MACLTMAFAPVQAQNDVKTTDGNVTVYNFNQPITICGEDAILAASFFSVSGNGEYAVAYDDFLSGASFLWTRSTGELTILYGGEGDEENVPCYIYDVANDGTVVGVFQSPDDNLCHPGYYKDGKWTALPVPETVPESDMQYMAYAPVATLISDDAKVITGVWGGAVSHPVQWVDGQLKEFPKVPIRNIGVYPLSMKQDGSVIVGLAASEFGDHLPMYIKDGKLTYIYDTPEGAGNEVPGGVSRAMMLGRTLYIDEAGMAYGYLSNENSQLVQFCLDTNTGVKVETDYAAVGQAGGGNLYACHFSGSGEFISSTQFVKTADGELSLNEYWNTQLDLPFIGIQASSTDGSVLIGGTYTTLGDMGVVVTPVVAVCESLTGISQAVAERPHMAISPNGVINVSGHQGAIRVFNVEGKQVATATQGQVDLSQQPRGMYLLQVSAANGQTSTFKVIR